MSPTRMRVLVALLLLLAVLSRWDDHLAALGALLVIVVATNVRRTR